MTIVRIILTLCLIYGSYTETGPWTALSFFLMFLGFESSLHRIKAEKNNREGINHE